MATALLTPCPRDTRTWLKDGVVGGILAGLIFIAFETMAATLITGPNAVFMPLRMIGGIVLGATTVESTTAVAPVVGAIVHFVLSAVFGAIFGVALGWMVDAVPPLLRSIGSIVVVAGAYGLALWVVNFYAIAPWAGWRWFPNQGNSFAQLVAHTVFFGTPLGIYLADRTTAKRMRLPRPGVQTPERMRRVG